MNITIALFAGIADRVGKDQVSVELDVPATVNQVLDQLAETAPQAAPMIKVSRLAVNDEFVEGEFLIDGSQTNIALIPPVSGG